MQVALVSVGVVTIVLIGLEVTARVRLPSSAPRLQDAPAWHPLIAAEPWGPEYFESLRGFNWRQRFAPYVGFRSVPHHSSVINIGDDGRRVTPGSAEDPGALDVHLFGGSTMIGVGVPDSGTIAAYVAERVNITGARPVRVVNHGQAWWASTQSVVDLLLTLRQGERPDVVIFYDGVNDFSVVSYGGRPGGTAPYAEKLLTAALDEPWSPTSPSLLAALRFPELLAHVPGVGLLLPPSGVERTAAPASRPEIPAAAADALVAQAAAVYEQNVRLVVALGKEYGFRTYFFVQPFPLVSGKRLTKAEEKILKRTRLAWEERMLRQFYAILGSSAYLRSLPEFTNLADVLDGEQAPLFLDTEHLLPRGNEIVARAILAASADGLGLSRPR